MKQYLKSKKTFDKARLRYFLFSSGGALLVLLTCFLAYHYQKSIIIDQSKTLSIYSTIGNQLKLIDDLVEISDVALLRDNKDVADEAAKEFRVVLSDLNEKNLQLLAWMNGNSEIAKVVFADINQKKVFEDHFLEFMTHSDQALSANVLTRDTLRENIDYLVSKGRKDLKNFLFKVSESIEGHQEQYLKALSQTSIYLIAFMIVIVLAVWSLVFQPLYLTTVRLHEDLSEAMLKTQSANRLKNQFLANISHEIRTPMTAILGYTNELIGTKVKESDRKHIAQVISNNASHLMELIDEILDVSKIESGKFQVEPSPTSLIQLVNEVYSLLNVKAREKNLNFEVSNSGEVPDIVMVDKKRLKQILFNLLGNAIKFTEKGFVELCVSMQSEKGKNYLVFDIKDSGQGIAKKDQARLFRPFEQINSESNRHHSGSGLGLVLSRGIARAMGGNLKIVNSTLGKGTHLRAVIEIKEYIPSTLTDTIPTNVIPEHKVAHQPTNLLNGERILVVDDAKENARLFSMILNRAGGDVDVALDGHQAIDKVKNSSSPYSLILLDLQMPGKDGFEVLSELRAYGIKTPIVALTAHAMVEERQKTKKAGFDGHLTKPVSADHLTKSAAKYINTTQAHDLNFV